MQCTAVLQANSSRPFSQFHTAQLQHHYCYTAPTPTAALHHLSNRVTAVRALQATPLLPTFHTHSLANPVTADKFQPRRQPRPNMQTCSAGHGWFLPAAVEAQLQKLQGGKVAFVCSMLFIVSQVLFHHLTTKIAAAVPAVYKLRNSGVVISPLDVQSWPMHPLYTPTSLVKTLTAWGPEGMAAFAVYEFVDLILFFAAYSGLILAWLNWIRHKMQPQPQQLLQQLQLQAQQGVSLVIPELVRWGYLFVVLLLVVDLCEDLLQLLLCDTFKQVTPAAAVALGHIDADAVLMRQSLWWRAVAVVCSIIHALKWLLVVLNIAVVLWGTTRVLGPKATAWLLGGFKRD